VLSFPPWGYDLFIPVSDIFSVARPSINSDIQVLVGRKQGVLEAVDTLAAGQVVASWSGYPGKFVGLHSFDRCGPLHFFFSPTPTSANGTLVFKLKSLSRL
jgi:hypothetical protein